MLYVTFRKLTASGAQQVCAIELRPRKRQSHRVLQLVAKSISPTRLIEGTSCPHSAGHYLVKQPAIYQDVDVALGCHHLYCANDRLPVLVDTTKAILNVFGPIFLDEGACAFGVSGLTQQKHNVSLCPR